MAFEDAPDDLKLDARSIEDFEEDEKRLQGVVRLVPAGVVRAEVDRCLRERLGNDIAAALGDPVSLSGLSTATPPARPSARSCTCWHVVVRPAHCRGRPLARAREPQLPRPAVMDRFQRPWASRPPHAKPITGDAWQR